MLIILCFNNRLYPDLRELLIICAHFVEQGKTAGSNISLDKLPPPPSCERPFNAERTSKADFDIPLKPISGGSHNNSDSFSSKNPSADESVVFLTQAESIVRRIMKCVALDDPNIKKVRNFSYCLVP